MGCWFEALIGFPYGLDRAGGSGFGRHPGAAHLSQEMCAIARFNGGTKRFRRCPLCIMRHPGLSIHLSAWRGDGR